MKTTLLLSLVTFSALYSAEIELSTIGVESTLLTDVAQNAQVSADVAEALSTSVPSIDMSRRSGIANDILIRGQKRDNITVEVDGSKVYGACPNRMDPPVSHILANQIKSIEVIEGPYDVETFGTMSGGIKIETKSPTQQPKGEINVGFGSFNYKKFGATGSGGNDILRVSITASMESSDQYKDGDANTIAKQIDNYADATNNPGVKLKPEYHDMQAYSKKSILAKAFITTAENQELRLSLTANRSDNILYGNSKMDALYDDSNLYNIAYNIDSLSKLVTNVNLHYYHSDVDHPMATKFRLASNMASMDNTNHLTTAMDGLKLKSTLDISSYELLLGVDASERKWDGRYYNTTTGGPTFVPNGAAKSIDDTVTKNSALFAKLKKEYAAFSFSTGVRYDTTRITNHTYNSNDYESLGINLVTHYNINSEHKLFLALGQAYRVPDARELYFMSVKGKLVGTPDLEQTRNQEIDLGYESDNENFSLKIKAFYSQLHNYIYYQKEANGVAITQNNFVNIDAFIYGLELSSSVFLSDDISLDLWAAYKRGEKDKALEGQTGTNLADIAPLRGTLALNYEYKNNSLATLEVVASETWNEIDAENGEQELSAWSIVNARVKHAINRKFDFSLGVNNIFNETYAQSNTYADLTLITGGSSDVMLMNEPGRYIYTNLDFKF